jgi:aconitate hydratase
VEAKVLLKVGDNITTDHIMPAGAQITALRSNIPAISEYVFSRVDEGFVSRARQADGGIVLGGENYGQGSSREHAALAPRHLGIRAIVAKSFARIHRANLVNFGILPLTLVNADEYDGLELGDQITLHTADLVPEKTVTATVGADRTIELRHGLTEQELAIIKAGGLLNTVRGS